MVDLPFAMLEGSGPVFWKNQGLVMSCAAANRLDSAALSKCRSAKDSKWQKPSGEFHTKNQTSPPRKWWFRTRESSPQQNNSGQKNEGFLVEFAGKFVEKNWLSHPSEVKTFKRKRAPTRPSEWFTTGWRRKSLNLLDPKEHDIKEKRIVFFFLEKHQKRTCHFRDDL